MAVCSAKTSVAGMAACLVVLMAASMDSVLAAHSAARKEKKMVACSAGESAALTVAIKVVRWVAPLGSSLVAYSAACSAVC